MAQILFAARNLPSGYRLGDPIVAKPDDHVWGASEGLPDFAVVKITDLDHEVAQSRIEQLFEPAQITDPEFNAPDEADRRIPRHRRRIRLIWGDLPGNVRNQLQNSGYYEANLAQMRSYIRKLQYNRGTLTVDETAEEEF